MKQHMRTCIDKETLSNPPQGRWQLVYWNEYELFTKEYTKTDKIREHYYIKNRIVANGEINHQIYLQANGDYHHSIYFTLCHDWYENNREVGGGVLGLDTIKKYCRNSKALQALEPWHLWHYQTGSMHYLENAKYWLNMAFNPDYQWYKESEVTKAVDCLANHIQYGKLTNDYMTPLSTITVDWLEKRLPAINAQFRYDLRSCAIALGSSNYDEIIPLLLETIEEYPTNEGIEEWLS